MIYCSLSSLAMLILMLLTDTEMAINLQYIVQSCCIHECYCKQLEMPLNCKAVHSMLLGTNQNSISEWKYFSFLISDIKYILLQIQHFKKYLHLSMKSKRERVHGVHYKIWLFMTSFEKFFRWFLHTVQAKSMSGVGHCNPSCQA